MRILIQDLRYGLRLLSRSPGFTAIALLTLTLGIGATAAIFSVVDAVLLRPLPYRDPQHLVSVFEDISQSGFPRNTPAPGNYADWKAQTQIFEDVAAAGTGGRWHALNLTQDTGAGPAEPEKLESASLTRNLFAVLGVTPAVGRMFLPEEDRPGAAARGAVQPWPVDAPLPRRPRPGGQRHSVERREVHRGGRHAGRILRTPPTTSIYGLPWPSPRSNSPSAARTT